MSHFLDPDKRKHYIEYFEKKLHLDEPIKDLSRPSSLINYANGHITFAKELNDRPSREFFIDALWKLIDENAYGPVDWDMVESYHEGGVFMSEIVTEMYTKPYLFGLSALIALRELIPDRTPEEVDVEISKMVEIFKDLSWGHGIERPWVSRDIVNKLSNAGAFPINTEMGYLEVLSPIYNKLITASEDTSGWGNDPPTIFKAKVLLSQITINDVPSETYDQKFLDELNSKEPSIFWILERKIKANQIILILKSKDLLLKLFTFPWHAVSFEYSQEDLDRLKEISSGIENLSENEALIFCLIKLDSLED